MHLLIYRIIITARIKKSNSVATFLLKKIQMYVKKTWIWISVYLRLPVSNKLRIKKKKSDVHLTMRHVPQYILSIIIFMHAHVCSQYIHMNKLEQY